MQFLILNDQRMFEPYRDIIYDWMANISNKNSLIKSKILVFYEKGIFFKNYKKFNKSLYEFRILNFIEKKTKYTIFCENTETVFRLLMCKNRRET